MSFPRIILGLLFCVSAILKLISLSDFELYVFSFGLASFDVCSFATRLLIAFEAILGLGLVSGWRRKPTNWTTALVLVVFSSFLIWRIALKDEESCHCFGSLVEMNPVESLIKNGVFGILLLLGWKGGEIPLGHRARLWIASVLSVGIIALSFGINPPDYFYRIAKGASADLNAEEFSRTNLGIEGKKVVCFFSTQCEHCHRCLAKVAGIIKRNSLNESDFLCIFLQNGETTDTDIMEFYDAYSSGLSLPFTTLDPLTFINLTNGSMPLVCLVSGNNLIKEFDLLTLDESYLAEFLLNE